MKPLKSEFFDFASKVDTALFLCLLSDALKPAARGEVRTSVTRFN